MRKYLLIIAIACVSVFAANAETVSKDAAATQAAAFLHLKSTSQLTLLDSPYENLFIFSIDAGGFVIVSADNHVQPILGYSNSQLLIEQLPPNFAAWINSYDKQIRDAMNNEALPVHHGWLNGKGNPKSGAEGYDSIVGPLLTTTWDQSPLYNNLCPMDGNQRTLTGCVATAMAQILKYWNWPATGVGQHSYTTTDYGTLSADFGATTYDWTNMPTALTNLSGSTQVTAVATLMYHCGVAVEMGYGVDASGIRHSIMYNNGLNLPCPENALRAYFKYSPALTGVRRADFTGDEWAALMKNEIDHHRPILYSGVGRGEGHEFVCDGYDTNGFFHFNWGWSGVADGYFTFARLTPGDFNFSITQDAIIGIEPDTLFGTAITCTVTATSADTTKGRVTGGGVYNYRDTVMLYAQANDNYRFLQWSNGSTVNPYPLLAHDFSITAHFTQALAEDGDILSYCGTNDDHRGTYTIGEDHRIGIKLPASVLGGHNTTRYVSAVEFYHYRGKYVVNIHSGGEDAPGPIVYSQPFIIPSGGVRWYRANLETPVPIDTNNNLWITIRALDALHLTQMGVPNLGVRDGNWISEDNGETWTHLNQLMPNTSVDDTSICWFIRCVTTADSLPGTTLAPTAFLLAPDQANIGDTVLVELMCPTSSTVMWDFGEADTTHTVTDPLSGQTTSVSLVWNSVGEHTVSADVTNPYGTTTVSNTLLITDCGVPVNTFPYEINYTSQDAMLRSCWQWFFRGEDDGYFFQTDYISVYLVNGTDNWYVSPLIDFSTNPTLTKWLQLKHLTPGNCLITVELSQGGLDSADFTPIYVLPTSSSETPVNSELINLSEHYQGNPVRIAIRLRRQEGPGDGKFELRRILISEGDNGIANAVSTPLTVSPNPASQKVTVTLPNPDGTLTLFDATGRQLMHSQAVSTETTLDVSALPQGVYMLQYTTSLGTTTTKVVVGY